MYIINFFQMNDWEIKRFLSVILSIQFAMWGAIGLDAVSLQIPILRQLIGFIYLLFVPGILILRILKLHNLGNTETLLCTIGLSIATLMFAGLLMNMVYPFFGIFGPISLMPLVTTISAIVLFLCILSYIRDNDSDTPSLIDLGEVLSPPVLFVCLIPFMAILGTYLVNYYHNNILLMLMIFMISIVALVIIFSNFIPKGLYSLAIFVIAISLIFHRSLISPIYINEHDLALVCSLINSIITHSMWDLAMAHNYNATLSTVMLAPIFHIICAMDLASIFNIIYYALCSIIYLGLYNIFQKITDYKIAFLSAFYLICFLRFPGQDQIIAEIFLVLLIMLIIDIRMKISIKKFLSVIFAISLVMSHYGTSYLFMFSLIFVLFLRFLNENPSINRQWGQFRYFIIGEKETIKAKKFLFKNYKIKNINKVISIKFSLLFIIFTIAWYMYVSSSSALNMIIHLGDQIADAIFIEFLSPETSRGAALLVRESASLLHRINKILQLAIPLLISIGIFNVLQKHRETKFEKEYIGFSLYWFAICLASIVIPFFAVMNPERLYRLSLFFISPFAVIGGINFFNAIVKLRAEQSLKIISILYVILLMFNTGFIFEISKDYPNSISLSQDNIENSEYPEYRAQFYIKIISEEDVFSAKWLSNVMKSDEKIYASFATGERALVGYGRLIPESSQMCILSNTTERIEDKSYIYLGAINVLGRIGVYFNPKLGSPMFFNMNDTYSLLKEQNKIYTNRGSDVLLS